MTAKIRINPAMMPAAPYGYNRRKRQGVAVPEGIPIETLQPAIPKEHKEKKEKKALRTYQPTVWTPERDRLLEEMYLQRRFDDEIAEKLGLTDKQVKARIYGRKRNGTLPWQEPRKRIFWNEEREKKLMELYFEGRSYQEIAEILGTTASGASARVTNLRQRGIIKTERRKACPAGSSLLPGADRRHGGSGLHVGQPGGTGNCDR